MKILSLVLSLCITFNVLAASGTVSELERVIDSYQYSMTVEWDQKDQKFYDTKTDAFIAQVAQVIKKEGLTKDQVLAMSEKRVQDKQALEAMKLKMSLLDKNMSSEELATALRDSSKEFYSKGASWNGKVAFIAPIALFAVIIGYFVWWDATHECVQYEEQYRCHTNDVCVSYSYDYEYGGSYCSVYRQDTYCGWEDVCTKYEKK